MTQKLNTIALTLLLALLITGVVNAADAKPDIPSLNWQERSDWVNVKTDITPAAIGDGVADDTAAIQAALDSINTGSVIYFPAGNYRITKPLRMVQEAKVVSVNLIGHGRDTRLFWDGEKGAYMLTINGQSMSRYMGINFDGRNIAARGIYFFNIEKGSFVTNLLYKDLAFRNFTDTGIYYETEKRGNKIRDKYATAETVYDNCLFENNGEGIRSHWFNDLNHTFTGCEFRNNNIGIHFGHGNFYVRDSHFEGSKEYDIKADYAEHGVTLRRITSTNSAQFLYFNSSVGVLTIENCRVKHWTHPQKAMVLRTHNALLFDNVFEGAPDSQSSVTYDRQRGTRVLSNNTMKGSTNLLFQEQHLGDNFRYTPDQEPRVFHKTYVQKYFTTIQLPESASKVKPVDIAMDQSFLKTTRTVPGKIFDAKVDFGATGDNQTDDTEAIQKTIDAARTHGNNAIAYIPTGKYVISKTLRITGENYTVEGTGYASMLVWNGAEGENLVEVKAPKNLVLSSLGIGQGDRGQGKQHRDVFQIGVNEPTSILYDRLITYGKYMRNDRRGIELNNLGPDESVVLDQTAGNLMLDNCAQATILGKVTYEGALTIQGDSKKRDGFTGFMTRLSTHVSHSMAIRNNHSVVVSEFFIERSPNVFRFEGTPSDPAGRATIQASKIDAMGKKEYLVDGHVFHVDGYTGEVFLGTTAYYPNPNEMKFSLRGNAKADLYFLGNLFYQSAPVYVDTTPSVKSHWLGAQIVGPRDVEAREEAVKSNVSEGDYHHYNVMLDDLRTLGAYDLKLNYPHVAQ